jgi:apolipoprotein N-acyltransferase
MAKSSQTSSKLVAVLAISAFGALSGLAYPRFSLWPLIFVSVAGIFATLRNRSLPQAAVLGFFAGEAFYVSQIYWISQYLGPVPLIALATLEALIFAVGAVAITLTWRLIGRMPKSAALWTAAPLLATVWITREWISINWPYGGFPWARLAMSQSESPLADWAYLGGMPLLGWVVALIAALIAQAVVDRDRVRLLGRTTALRLTGILTVFAVGMLITPPTNAEEGTIKIAAVQGNANAGLFANPVRGSILEKHLRASRLVIPPKSTEKPDLVVWPENSADINPASDPSTAIELNNFVTNQLGAPLILGTITERDSKFYNESQLWLPDKGPVDYYAKKRPIPFAEYVPDRDFWYALAPDLIGLIVHGYDFGTRDGIYEVAETKVGVNICFEIAVDELNRDLVSGGARVIVSQTNNSDFGHSDETFQQAAIARLRAIETGRVVVNDSTVGVTAAFAPDGSTIASIEAFKPGAITFDAALRTSTTPAYWFGPFFVLAVNLSAAIAIAIGITLELTTRQRRKRGET